MTGIIMDNNIRKNIFMWLIIVLCVLVVVSLLVSISAIMINSKQDEDPINNRGNVNYAEHNGSAYAGNTDGNIEGTTIDRTNEKANKELYFLIYTRERVEIYTGDGELYDYADVNTELMPKDVFLELKQGMYIKGNSDLYDFLQAYSS